MSAFLSKVHYQLYDKIKYQEKLSNLLYTLLLDHNKDIDSLDAYLLPQGALEDVIDHQQIHGWLLEHITSVENRYAHFINMINEASVVTQAKTIFFEEGKALSHSLEINDVVEAFQNIQPYMLDGMPCDRGIAMIRNEEDIFSFQSNVDVHTSIQNISLYMELRLAWMQGFLQAKGFEVIQDNINTFTIKKESSHE